MNFCEQMWFQKAIKSEISVSVRRFSLFHLMLTNDNGARFHKSCQSCQERWRNGRVDEGHFHCLNYHQFAMEIVFIINSLL